MRSLIAAAAAASLWSPPANVSAPHTFVDSPRVVVSADGRALASWTWQDGLSDQRRSGTSLASRPRGAGFAAERPLPGGSTGTTVGPVAYGRSRAVVAQHFTDRIAVRFGLTTGSFGALRTIAFSRRLRRPVIAANQRGDVALAWFEDRGTSNDRVYVSIRRSGRGFGRPILLEQGRIRSVAAAVGGRGDVLVAWDARGVVRARMRRAGRPRFDREDTIRSEDAYSAQLQAAVAPSGRAYVAWTSQHLTEGGPAGPVIHQVAVRPAGSATRFRDAQLLEVGGAAHGPLKIGLDARGNATVAWTGRDEGGRFDEVRYAVSDARAVLRQAGRLSDPAGPAVLGDVAVAPDGAAVIVWVVPTSDAWSGQLFASHRPAGGTFGAAEPVSGAEEARVPGAAFDPVAGRPLAIWSNRPDRPPTGTPTGQIRTYAQVSVRTG